MKKKIILIGVGTIIAFLCLAGCTSSPQKELDSNTNSNPPPQQTDTEIFIPVSNLSTTAKFYSFESEGVTIRYFAVKDASGNVHIAFDACDVCYEAKKGYRQNGDVMHCINCGKEFPITSIGTDNTDGGCWPSYLPMRIDENTVVIKIADLVAKQYMFS
ncbi:MAG: DUF2318 domain-containing protein [Candidatus Thermoplasmatota archaeon]|nr:DUF2318 domain-containing protein [Candidatus Thermoplasmatota archaeon]